jgi:hypothetical protein
VTRWPITAVDRLLEPHRLLDRVADGVAVRYIDLDGLKDVNDVDMSAEKTARRAEHASF